MNVMHLSTNLVMYQMTCTKKKVEVYVEEKRLRELTYDSIMASYTPRDRSYIIR